MPASSREAMRQWTRVSHAFIGPGLDGMRGEWDRMSSGNFPAESCVLVTGRVLCFQTHSSTEEERGKEDRAFPD